MLFDQTNYQPSLSSTAKTNARWHRNMVITDCCLWTDSAWVREAAGGPSVAGCRTPVWPRPPWAHCTCWCPLPPSWRCREWRVNAVGLWLPQSYIPTKIYRYDISEIFSFMTGKIISGRKQCLGILYFRSFYNETHCKFILLQIYYCVYQ